MSKWYAEVSIYIRYVLYRNWSQKKFPKKKADLDFKTFFMHLKDVKQGPSKDLYSLDKQYAKMRPQYCKNYQTKWNTMMFAIRTYETAFVNNLAIHSYNRLKAFLAHMQIDEWKETDENMQQRRFDTLNYIFNGTRKELADTRMLRLLVSLGYNELEKLGSIRANYHKHVKLFYNIQRLNQEHEWKNFKLIPMFKHKLHHIRYDDAALHEVLRALKLVKGEYRVFDGDTEWRKYFDVGPLETQQHKFDYSIMTDGVSISFQMNRPKTSEASKEMVLAKVKTKLDGGRYSRKIGLDPGCRLMIGGVTEDEDWMEGGNREIIKLRSSQFRAMSGAIGRLYKRKTLCQSIDGEFNAESVKFPQKSTQGFKEFTEFRLAYFQRKQDAYAKRSVARLSLKKYICVHKTTTNIAKWLVGVRQATGDGNENQNMVNQITKNQIKKGKKKRVKRKLKKVRTIVFIGSTKTAANSIIRGYIRTPQPMLLQKLRRFADVVEVNEFRTTILCSSCYKKAPPTDKKAPPTKKKPNRRMTHRYQHCNSCHITWNRDVNAGLNIMYVGEQRTRGLPEHRNFYRTTKLH